MADSLYKFYMIASLSLYCHSPDGTAGTLPNGRSAAMESVVVAAI